MTWLLVSVVLALSPAPGCTRGGGRVVERSGDAVIVRMATAREKGGGWARGYHACWRPTGRRVPIGGAGYTPDSGRSWLRAELVGGRYAGVTSGWEREDIRWSGAEVFDVRAGRSVLTSKGCSGESFLGARFLRTGGMVYWCGRLYLYRRPGARREQLDSRATAVRLRDGRLSWRAGGAERSLDLAVPACTRAGATEVTRSGEVVVVRTRKRRFRQIGFKREVLGCWQPTGRRVWLGDEWDVPDADDQGVEVEVVAGRYAGVRVAGSDPVAWWSSAHLVDVQAGRYLHGTSCGAVYGQAVFLRTGGMAYSCEGALYLWPSDGPERRTLETAGVVGLQLVRTAGGERLEWRVDGDPQVRTLDV